MCVYTYIYIYIYIYIHCQHGSWCDVPSWSKTWLQLTRIGIWVCTCVYIYTDMCLYVCMYTYIHCRRWSTYIHIHTYTRIHTDLGALKAGLDTCTYMHTHTQIGDYKVLEAALDTHIHTYTQLGRLESSAGWIRHIHIHIDIHTHTHIHTYIHTQFGGLQGA